MNTYVHGGCDCLDNVPSNVPESRLSAPFIPTRRRPQELVSQGGGLLVGWFVVLSWSLPSTLPLPVFSSNIIKS